MASQPPWIEVVPRHLAHDRRRNRGARRLSAVGPGSPGGLRRARRSVRRRLVLRLELRFGLEENLMLVVLQHLGGLRLVVFEAGIVDLVERHGARVLAQLGDLLGAEAAALVEHRRSREIARRDEEAIGDVAFVGLARRRHHGRVELQHRFRRLFLVPERDREHAAVLQRAHVAGHRLARVGIFLDDGEAARARQPRRIRETQVDDVVALRRIGEIEPAVVVDHLELGIVEHVAGEIAQSPCRCGRPRAPRDFPPPR